MSQADFNRVSKLEDEIKKLWEAVEVVRRALAEMDMKLAQKKGREAA